MKTLHRFALGLLLLSVLGPQAFAKKPPPKHRHPHSAVRPHPGRKSSFNGVKARKAQPEPVITDSSSEAAWRKKLPWLYRDSSLSLYREALLRPLCKQYGLNPGRLSRRGGFVEMEFPRGKPLHEYAYQMEALCGQNRIRVLEGHEFDPPEEKMEYRLQADSGAPFGLRLTLGKTVLAGSAHMALVIVSLDSAKDDDAQRLRALPFSLTFSIAAGDSLPVPARWQHLPSDKEALLDLPMEPSNYPYVRPGPGALFIHYSRSEVERLLKDKLKTYPAATGFATTFGDRAIENRPLVENAMGFMAAHSLIFLDLTGSPRSLTSAVALQTGGVSYSARVQEPDSGEKLEAEFLRRCDRAAKTGQGVWVLRYFPGLPGVLQGLVDKNRDHFQELGLGFSTLSALNAPPK